MLTRGVTSFGCPFSCQSLDSVHASSTTKIDSVFPFKYNLRTLDEQSHHFEFPKNTVRSVYPTNSDIFDKLMKKGCNRGHENEYFLHPQLYVSLPFTQRLKHDRFFKSVRGKSEGNCQLPCSIRRKYSYFTVKL